MIETVKHMITEQKPIMSGFGSQTTAAEVVSGIILHGKTAVVTGGHSGIGLETTRALSQAGATVVIGARDLNKASQQLSGIDRVETIELDLAEPDSVDRFAEAFLRRHSNLDLLINNAGIMRTPTLMRNRRGHELQFATNHLGHFQLTKRLFPVLQTSGNARVVSLSSIGHRYGPVNLKDPDYHTRPYDKALAYGESKTANSLFATELDRRGHEHGIRAFAVHPGGVLTDLVRYLTDAELKVWGITRLNGKLVAPSSGYKTPEQGAATTLWCAVSPQLQDKGGLYCEDCNIARLVPNDYAGFDGVREWAIEPQTAKALWDLSERIIEEA
jgi:NAD(P)-dependent dehydrogenase (short-subunit alcohol dehydrogenase family)